jgi:hypothetical protein
LTELSDFFAREISHSLASGVMVRTFKAFVRVMETLHSSICGEGGAHGPTLGAVSHTLWGALGSFTTPDSRIVLPTIHLALQYR